MRQQVHGYLDAIIELEAKLQDAYLTARKREEEWGGYCKSLWNKD